MGNVEMWVEGPMYPDLFGGETPIMIKMTGPLLCLVGEEIVQALEEKECTLTQN
jgi:hypothetical protein